MLTHARMLVFFETPSIGETPWESARCIDALKKTRFFMKRGSALKKIGNDKSARSFSDRSFFHGRLRGCPCPNAFFLGGLEGLTEVLFCFLGRMSAGRSGP